METAPVPFDNTSFGIGDLTVESATDVVAMHGSLDLRRDRQGLEAARVLASYLADLVAELERQDALGSLPLAQSVNAPVILPSPFA